MVFLVNKCGDYWYVSHDGDDYFYGDGHEAFVIGFKDDDAKRIVEEILEVLNRV
jgi:hypothetical protein